MTFGHTGEPVGGVEEKTAAALVIIDKALSRAGAPAVAFGGGKESVVLMHLMRRFAQGREAPVLFVKPGREYSRLFYFVEKMRRLWGLKLVTVERAETQEAGGPILPSVREEVSGLLRYAFQRRGMTHLFMGLRRSEEGAGKNIMAVTDVSGVALVNPLAGFSEEDVWEYLNRYNLPVCSLYKGRKGKIGCLPSKLEYSLPVTHASDDADDEADVRERLKSLGYL